MSKTHLILSKGPTKITNQPIFMIEGSSMSQFTEVVSNHLHYLDSEEAKNPNLEQRSCSHRSFSFCPKQVIDNQLMASSTKQNRFEANHTANNEQQTSKQILWNFCPVSFRNTKQCAMIMHTRMHHAITAPSTELCRKFTLNRQATPNRNSLFPRSLRRQVASLAPFTNRSTWKRQ